MKGLYRVYLDGKLVSESPNILTNFGKATIIRYLAGNITSYGNAIAVGVDSTIPSASNVDLNYELFRIPVSFKTASLTDNSVIFKATAPVGSAGSIRELGLFPTMENAVSGAYQTRTLFEFTGSESWSNVTGRDVDNSRVGLSGISISGGTSVTIYNTNISLDLSGYSDTDIFKLAVVRYDSDCTSIQVKFTTSDGNDIYGAFAMGGSPPSTPHYQIISVNKSAFSNQGANWRDITQAEITATFTAGTGKVTLDGLKVVDADQLNPEFGLISHSILSTPVTKDANNTMDIEYRLVVPL